MVRRFLPPGPDRRSRVLSGLVLVVASTLPAVAQNPLWVRQIGTAATDYGGGAAPDGSGGVYWCGSTGGDLGGSNAGYQDAWLTRYDDKGVPIWILQYGTSASDQAEAVAPDGSGGVFVTARTLGDLGGTNAGNVDVCVSRFDKLGNHLWTRQIGTLGVDEVGPAAPDGSGGVFVGGYTSASLGGAAAGGYDAWLGRFDGTGTLLWIRQFGTQAFEATTGLAPDGRGGVLASGHTDGRLGAPNAGLADAWVARYDGAGNRLWIQQFGTPSQDWAYGAAPDASGGVYVTGLTEGSLGGASSGLKDAWVARYDGAGNRLWVVQLGTGVDDAAYGAAADGAGGVYIGGYTGGSLGGSSAGGADAWLARYDGQATRLGITQLGSSSSDYGRGLSPDGSGGAYISGDTDGSLGGTTAGGQDAWLARYAGVCAPPVSYCVASTTSIPGCQAAIGGIGTPSYATPTGFTISSGAVPGSNIGICFFGNHGRASIPFGTLGGQICVQGPVFRSKPRLSGGTKGSCDGVFNFTLQDLIDQSPIVFAGAVLNAEIWARDPANPDGFLLSDGLEFTVCP